MKNRLTVGRRSDRMHWSIIKPDSWIDEGVKYRFGWLISSGNSCLTPTEAKKLHQWLGDALKLIEKKKLEQQKRETKNERRR